MLVILVFVDIGIFSMEVVKIYGGCVGIKRLISRFWFIVIEIYEEEIKLILFLR